MLPSAVRLTPGKNMLAESVRVADQAANQFGIAGQNRSVLCLVVEELVSNIQRHGALETDGWISIEIDLQGNQLMLKLEDNGTAFDPRHDLSDPDLKCEVEKRLTGGLGWPMILHFFQISSYCREQETNQLTLHADLVK